MNENITSASLGSGYPYEAGDFPLTYRRITSSELCSKLDDLGVRTSYQYVNRRVGEADGQDVNEFLLGGTTEDTGYIDGMNLALPEYDVDLPTALEVAIELAHEYGRQPRVTLYRVAHAFGLTLLDRRAQPLTAQLNKLIAYVRSNAA